MANLFHLPVVLATDPVNGVPLSGGRLYFYKNNTSTPKDTYTTSAKTTPHTNPVVADSGGYFPEIWLDGVYSWKLTDADDVLIDEGDDLSGLVSVLINNVFQKLNTFDGGLVIDPEHATDSGTDAYVSATNTSSPGNGKTITRDFQSANTTTPTLDSLTITTKDGSALWAGALSGVHELQYDSSGPAWRVVDPNPSEQVDPIARADTKARIATGTYTGDGTDSQSITGLGFQPKYLKIWPRATSGGISSTHFETTDTMVDDNASGMAFTHEDAGSHIFRTQRILSLDADGFTVDDRGSDDHPNSNGVVYSYMAIG